MAPRFTAGNAVRHLGQPVFSRQRWKTLYVFLRKHHHDLIDVGAILKTLQRMNDYRYAVEFQKLLGPLAAHSDTLAGRGNNGNIHLFTVQFDR